MLLLSKNYLILSLLFVSLAFNGFAQQETKIHSHNDYTRNAPFWEAYANGLESIEADVFLMDGELYVAHEKESIIRERTLRSLYLEPIQHAYNLNIRDRKPFQLLIDIKTEAYTTLDKIVEELAPFNQLLTGNSDNPLVKVVISGSRPKPTDYGKYPGYVLFDYQSITETTDLPLEKIALVSLNFRNFSDWNGKGRLVDEDQQKLEDAIKKAHALGKPIRFWATPDSKTAWKALKELGVDYINTDMPYPASAYLSSLEERLYISPNVRDIYKPTFERDGIPAPVKNVILMIGDGFGLAQLSAALYANKNQLTLTTLKNLGLIKTQAFDDFTTDSAAAGTALATGQKVKNRSVGAMPDGSPAQNLPEYLVRFNYKSGIVSTDNVTGATPGAFYAHRTERDMIKEIASDLAKSPLNLFIGGGKNDFIRYNVNELHNLEKAGFNLVHSLEQIRTSSHKKIGYFASNHGLPKVVQGRNGFLKNAVEASLDYFSRQNHPFFLMVEGAYIDSGGHANHVETVVEEAIDFDEAISAVLKFADENGETLIIITADHETGGVTIPQGNVELGQVELEFSTEDHTAIMVPVFAYGPHADEFRGIYENTDIFHKIIQLIEKYQKP